MSCHDISWPVSTSSLSSYDITEQVLCPLININVQHLPQHLPSVPRASAPPRENEVRAWSLRGSRLLIVSSLQYLTMPAIRPQSQPANARCTPRISVGHDFWLSVRRYYSTIPTVNPWSRALIGARIRCAPRISVIRDMQFSVRESIWQYLPPTRGAGALDTRGKKQRV